VKKQAYLIPRDIRLNKVRDKDPEIIKKTAISSNELMECIASVGAQQTLLVLDVCHSGAFGQLKGTNDHYGGCGFDRLQYFSSNVSGIAIIASCKSEKVSFGFNDGSIFTNYFIESLKYLSKDEEGVYLLRLVEHLQYKMENSPQIPIFKCDNIQNSHKWLLGLPVEKTKKYRSISHREKNVEKRMGILNIKVGGISNKRKHSRRNISPRDNNKVIQPKIIPSDDELEEIKVIRKSPEKRKREIDDEWGMNRKRMKSSLPTPSSPQSTVVPIKQEDEEPTTLEDNYGDESSSTPSEAYIQYSVMNIFPKKEEKLSQDFYTLRQSQEETLISSGDIENNPQ